MVVQVPVYLSQIEDQDFPIVGKFYVVNSVNEKVYFIEKLSVVSEDVSVENSPVFLECSVISQYNNDLVKVSLPYCIEFTDGGNTVIISKPKCSNT